MKRMNLVIVTAILLSLSWQSQAGVSKQRVQVQKFINRNCVKTASCSLQEFQLKTQEFKVTFSGGAVSFGTDALISYKTSQVANLEDYAVVQFIKGCKFHSRVESSGRVQKYGMVREFFGDHRADFKHSDWVIDSVDRDPMYNNGPIESRHAYYRWKKNGQDISYSAEKPSRPELFVRDLPGTASMDGRSGDFASNISLQFKACIYKTSEVPLQTTADDVNFGKALQCFSWESSHIYDHKKKIFESKRTLDPFCSL